MFVSTGLLQYAIETLEHVALMRLFRFGKGTAEPNTTKGPGGGARIPEGRLVYAIGDVHGRLDLLRILMEKVLADWHGKHPDIAQPSLVFLGDYVDRGFDSKGVIDFLLHETPKEWDCRYLKGNHEEALFDFMRDPEFGDVWQEYGGLQTLASYGVAPVRNAGKIDWKETAKKFDASFPRDHLAFLSCLSLYECIGDYVFVHAGVRPRIPLAYQSEKDLLWIREDFLGAGRVLSQTVVHGHTPGEKVSLGAGRIGIDTGAYITGKLTAAGFHGDDVWFLST